MPLDQALRQERQVGWKPQAWPPGIIAKPKPPSHTKGLGTELQSGVPGGTGTQSSRPESSPRLTSLGPSAKRLIPERSTSAGPTVSVIWERQP